MANWRTFAEIKSTIQEKIIPLGSIIIRIERGEELEIMNCQSRRIVFLIIITYEEIGRRRSIRVHRIELARREIGVE